MRVFYVLPRQWTDDTLPLTLQPGPRELVRVMVGRAEIIPPAADWELLKQIVLVEQAVTICHAGWVRHRGTGSQGIRSVVGHVRHEQ